MNKKQHDSLTGAMVMISNLDAINDSAEPNTLTLDEVKLLASDALDTLHTIKPIEPAKKGNFLCRIKNKLLRNSRA